MTTETYPVLVGDEIKYVPSHFIVNEHFFRTYVKAERIEEDDNNDAHTALTTICVPKYTTEDISVERYHNDGKWFFHNTNRYDHIKPLDAIAWEHEVMAQFNATIFNNTK